MVPPPGFRAAARPPAGPAAGTPVRTLTADASAAAAASPDATATVVVHPLPDGARADPGRRHHPDHAGDPSAA